MCKQNQEKEIKLTDGRIKSCDNCIHDIVQAFNDFGLQTTASCCGHGKQQTSIVLKDGREIMIFNKFEDARMVDKLFPPISPIPNGWKHTLKRKLVRLLLANN
jgi:hypothetical protein